MGGVWGVIALTNKKLFIGNSMIRYKYLGNFLVQLKLSFGKTITQYNEV